MDKGDSGAIAFAAGLKECEKAGDIGYAGCGVIRAGVGYSSCAVAAPSVASAQQTNMPPSPLPPVQIKAGISDPVNTVLAWYMARAATSMPRRELNVDIINMNGGSKGAEELPRPAAST